MHFIQVTGVLEKGGGLSDHDGWKFDGAFHQVKSGDFSFVLIYQLRLIKQKQEAGADPGGVGAHAPPSTFKKKISNAYRAFKGLQF